jgi:serine/threonine protein kinase
VKAGAARCDESLATVTNARHARDARTNRAVPGVSALARRLNPISSVMAQAAGAGIGCVDGARRIAAAGRAAFPRSLELAVTAAASELELASAPTRTVGGVGQRARPELPAPVAPRRFQIVRCLGYGGMGIVYEAIDRERGGRVALKRLRDAHPECLLRFKREFRCIAGRQHPNWVQAFELIEEDGHWFITMELVEGVDFLTWVLTGAGQRPFNERRLRDGLRQLVRAVAALHDAGKVHRDVKPENVLVTRSGRVVLLDFGLVVDLYEDDFICGESVGTPAYVAPEQMAAEPPDHAADWYSVGVLLYHALTGALPFAGTASQILSRKAAEDPMRPRERVAGVPDDLEQLCVALLARDPAARPSGRELLALLADSVDLERKRLMPEVKLDGELSAVPGDRVQLQEVLMNLMLNGM